MKFLKFLIRLFFPKHCVFCNTVIDNDTDMCKNCEGELNNLRNHYPVFTRYGKVKCVAPFKYTGIIKKAIWIFKFRNAKCNAKILAKYMITTIKRHYRNVKFDCIAYVPSNKIKKLIRGYNPVEELYNEISQSMNLFEAEPIIIKIKRTKEQKKLSFAKRLENLKGAFKVSEKFDMRSKTVLLIDDVKTTGSTIETIAKLLYESGAQQVYTVLFAVNEH